MTKKTKLSSRMATMELSDKALAKAVDIDRSMITKLRLGTVNPSLNLAIRICEKTGLRPEDLFKAEEAA